ncbi:hypothetical protein JTE90_020774 [Oedothorax gibbosus]|uniref:Integrase catalytic domain-containing protein n=1 Tax=Oedothorax gibbosus TaxID=931172 RepID=A0AAV6TRU8_9ARAC|nr:hypothetical protein JTE90_020774 [Oedothorax gibbosus]
MILVVQDAHSKWIEAVAVRNATTAVTIEKLYEIFARFGFPGCIVSDNGSVFRSAEFDEFIKRNGIRHLFTAPYHPSSNGQAERAVQFVKNRLKKVSNGSLSVRLSRILMNFRRTPLALHGISPAEIMLGRQIRCRLDLVHSPSPNSNALEAPHKSFQNGEEVYIRNYASGERWVPGVINNPIGNKMYSVERPGGLLAERHTDQIRPRVDSPKNNHDLETSVDSPPSVDISDSPPHASEPSCPADAVPPAETLPSPPPAVSTRHSTRTRKPPVRFRDYLS